MSDTNPNGLRNGDTIFVEQAWEDERGHYHDEFATITSIRKDGRIFLKFHTKTSVNDFLRGADFFAKDYKAEVTDYETEALDNLR